MKSFNVFQIELGGKCRKVGPDAGFSDEGTACGFALAAATNRWNNRCLYVIVSGELIVAVYPSAGTYAAIQMLEELVDDESDDELDAFDRVA